MPTGNCLAMPQMLEIGGGRPKYTAVFIRTWLVVCFCAGVSTGESAQDEPKNLLLGDGVSLVAGSRPLAAQQPYRAAVDGNPETFVSLDGAADSAIELIFDLGRVCTPRRLGLLATERNDAGGQISVDVLGSLVSPHAGYQMLRSVRAAASSETRSFEFSPTRRARRSRPPRRRRHARWPPDAAARR